jgi:hypothetical protein
MARIYDTAKSTLALRQRKRFLLSQLKICPDSLRHHGGAKHGPFYYLTQCLAVGKINKLFLKTDPQQRAARTGIEHYRQLQEQLEELSQINAELLRRQENLGGD